MRRISFIFILLTFGLSCNQYQEKVTEPDTNNDLGRVSISVSQAPDEIKNVIATLYRRNFEDRILILTISDSDESASGEFTDVPIGVWYLKVDARDNFGNVRYSGEKDVEVLPGQTSIVELELLPTTGSIEIHVTWGGKCTPLPSGIVSWWSGNGTANDIVGSNHGTMTNGASFVQGKVGQAFLLDGINDYIRIPNSPSLNPTGSFTVDAWIYPMRDGHATVFGSWGAYYDWYNQRAWNLALRPGRKVEFSIHK